MFSICKKGDAFAESIDPCHPAQSAETDHTQNCLLLVNCLRVKGPVYLKIQSVVIKNVFNVFNDFIFMR